MRGFERALMVAGCAQYLIRLLVAHACRLNRLLPLGELAVELLESTVRVGSRRTPVRLMAPDPGEFGVDLPSPVAHAIDQFAQANRFELRSVQRSANLLDLTPFSSESLGRFLQCRLRACQRGDPIIDDHS